MDPVKRRLNHRNTDGLHRVEWEVLEPMQAKKRSSQNNRENVIIRDMVLPTDEMLTLPHPTGPMIAVNSPN
jgi:hypothetical protein